jgi:sterol desaturase/sphingolipid hydroxylase (fatty acid hydroxylase superfamily)
VADVKRRPLLERIAASPINYWATFVTDVAVGLTFAWLGATRYAGSTAGAAVYALAGIVGWPLFEYSLHRWVLHGRVSPAFRGEHARHHVHPRDIASTPWLVSTIIGVLFWLAFSVVLSGAAAALVMSGIYAGYMYFVVMHRMQHYNPELLSRWWFLGNQMRLHELHHEYPDMYFGITSSLWDRVFGTCKARAELSSVMGSDPIERT